MASVTSVWDQQERKKKTRKGNVQKRRVCWYTTAVTSDPINDGASNCSPVINNYLDLHLKRSRIFYSDSPLLIFKLIIIINYYYY